MNQDEVLALITQVEDDHAVFANSAEVVARWDELRALALNAAADIAAAEERGRRAGIEERDELRALLRECKAAVTEAIEDGSWGFGPLLGRINAALAPRDSAPAEEVSDG